MRIFSNSGGVKRCMSLLEQVDLSISGQLLLNRLRSLFEHVLKWEITRKLVPSFDFSHRSMSNLLVNIKQNRQENLSGSHANRKKGDHNGTVRFYENTTMCC